MTELTGQEQVELAELSSDRSLKLHFKTMSLPSFWLSVSPEYPMLSRKAMTILLPLATTYLCEAASSALTNLKTRYRSKLQVDCDMRVCL